MPDQPELSSETIWMLQIIAQGLREDPGYLEGADYPADIMELFSGRRAGALLASVEEASAGIDLPSEIEGLFISLKKEGADFGDSESSEKMAYYRVATSLLEKLVSMKERANNVRQIGLFYSEVLAVMEEVLTVGQIAGVRERLLSKMVSV